jgi:hypothetical protein
MPCFAFAYVKELFSCELYVRVDNLLRNLTPCLVQMYIKLFDNNKINFKYFFVADELMRHCRLIVWLLTGFRLG